MPSEDTKILEFRQYEKSEKVSAIMHGDFESLIKEVGEGKINQGEKYMKNVFQSLRKHIIKIFQFEREKIIPSTSRVWISSSRYHSTCYICKNVFGIKNVRITIIITLHTNFIVKEKKKKGDAHNICNLKFGVSKEISVFFQNNMNYHYHFIIKELSKEFERDLTCLEEHNEKYITFSVRITVKT